MRFGCGSERIENGPFENASKDKEYRLTKRQTSYHDDCILGISIPDLPEKRGISPLISQVSRVDAQNYYHTKNKIHGNNCSKYLLYFVIEIIQVLLMIMLVIIIIKIIHVKLNV